MNSPLGRLVKQRRRSKGWTQEKLAEESGLSVRAIQRIEAGETISPNSDTLECLATVLEIEVAELERVSEDSRASVTAQISNIPRDNDEAGTPTPRNPAETPGSPPKKWQLIHTVVACIVFVSLLMLAIYTLIINPRIWSLEGTPGSNSPTQGTGVKPVILSGKVLCANNESVVGVWVKVENGRSGWTDLRKTNRTGSEVAFEYVFTGDAYNLHVGCGGSQQHWNGIYITEAGSGSVHDLKFHFFTCQDAPHAVEYGSCELQY